jgi:hypothetical protein
MRASACMFAGVLIRRAVAAQGYSAFLARSQMHPMCSDFYALTTLEARRVFHLGDRGKMSTLFVSHKLHRLNTRNKPDRHFSVADGRDLLAKTWSGDRCHVQYCSAGNFLTGARRSARPLRFALRSGLKTQSHLNPFGICLTLNPPRRTLKMRRTSEECSGHDHRTR